MEKILSSFLRSGIRTLIWGFSNSLYIGSWKYVVTMCYCNLFLMS